MAQETPNGIQVVNPLLLQNQLKLLTIDISLVGELIEVAVEAKVKVTAN